MGTTSSGACGRATTSYRPSPRRTTLSGGTTSSGETTSFQVRRLVGEPFSGEDALSIAPRAEGVSRGTADAGDGHERLAHGPPVPDRKSGQPARATCEGCGVA